MIVTVAAWHAALSLWWRVLVPDRPRSPTGQSEKTGRPTDSRRRRIRATPSCGGGLNLSHLDCRGRLILFVARYPGVERCADQRHGHIHDRTRSARKCHAAIHCTPHQIGVSCPRHHAVRGTRRHPAGVVARAPQKGLPTRLDAAAQSARLQRPIQRLNHRNRTSHIRV